MPTENVASDDKLKIFPNPVRDKIIISGDIQVAEIKVYNMNGVELLSRQGDEINEVDVSAFPPGTYFLRLSDRKHVYHRKIIII